MNTPTTAPQSRSIFSMIQAKDPKKDPLFTGISELGEKGDIKAFFDGYIIWLTTNNSSCDVETAKANVRYTLGYFGEQLSTKNTWLSVINTENPERDASIEQLRGLVFTNASVQSATE